MTTQKRREIVIEFEKVQMLRKRAKTTFEYCKGCGDERDFLQLVSAAELFGISVEILKAFVLDNAVHWDANGNHRSNICMASLIAVMQAKQFDTRIIGGAET